jgi:hypothetical protein
MAQCDPREKLNPYLNDLTLKWSEALPSPGTATIEKVVDHTQETPGVRKMAGEMEQIVFFIHGNLLLLPRGHINNR